MKAPAALRGSWRDWIHPALPLKLGVSACLLGEPVRYDQGHRRYRFLTDRLGAWVAWVPVCPEMEVGMGTPRPTIRLEEGADGDRLIAPDTGTDFTAAMRAYAEARVRELAGLDLDGYVLKSRSPSCGPAGLPVYRGSTVVRRDGTGAFARTLRTVGPDLPIEEEGKLDDPPARARFVERVFARNRWRVFLAGARTGEDLVAFHASHALQLSAHSETGRRALERLVAGAKTPLDDVLVAAYGRLFRATLAVTATAANHVRILRLVQAGLEANAGAEARREMRAAVEGFASGRVPLEEVLALLRTRALESGAGDLPGQIYLDPYPADLAPAAPQASR